MAQKKFTSNKENVKDVIQKLNQDIANGVFNPFYLLCGTEDYLKRQYRDNLITALVDKEDTMNYNYFDGDKLDIQNVLDIGDTLPFFAERRVIVLENTGLFDSKVSDDIKDRFSNFPDSTHVIFVEQKVDGKRSLYKWMKQQEAVFEMNTPDVAMLGSWIKKRCQEAGKQIGKEAIDYLIEHVGTDMLLLENEMKKLASYRHDSPQITVEDIREICVSQADEKMFDMLDAIGSRNQDKALLLYHDLLVLRMEPIYVLYMLTRHYHILLQVYLLKRQGMDNVTIADVCGFKNSPRAKNYLISKYVSQAEKYSYAELKGMLDKCQATDQGIKTGQIQDTVGVELLIVEFSGSPG